MPCRLGGHTCEPMTYVRSSGTSWMGLCWVLYPKKAWRHPAELRRRKSQKETTHLGLPSVENTHIGKQGCSVWSVLLSIVMCTVIIWPNSQCSPHQNPPFKRREEAMETATKTRKHHKTKREPYNDRGTPIRRRPGASEIRATMGPPRAPALPAMEQSTPKILRAQPPLTPTPQPLSHPPTRQPPSPQPRPNPRLVHGSLAPAD